MNGGENSVPRDAASQKAQLGVAPSNYFDPAFIALCGASYASPPQIAGEVAEVPSWDGTGRWQCVWGPALGDEQANLAFVAAYLAYGSNLPICAALVIRGTDATETWGDFVEAVEDLDVGTQVPYPPANDAAVQVAKGTLKGLGVIQSLVDPSTDEALPHFITRYFSDPQNENPILVVTGHSLGGCLATVVAPWAATLVPSNTPAKTVTFAAPTAGNPAFASWYANTIPNSMLYCNSLDVVPMAWDNLPGIKAMFAGGPSIPLIARAAVDGFIAITDGLAYGQTSPNGQLDGTLCDTSSWYDEAFAQHNHTTYISLMAGGGSNCGVTRQGLLEMMATGDPKLVRP